MRAALIIGANSRAGAGIARDLASRGWRVILCDDRSTPATAALHTQVQADGGEARLINLQADLAEPQAAADLIDRAFGEAEGLELLVHIAPALHGGTGETTSAAARVEGNPASAAGPIVLFQAFARRLPEGRSGAVVKILDGGELSGHAGTFPSSSSESDASSTTRMLALALAPRVRVNGIITAADNDACEGIAAAVRLIADSPAMTGVVLPIEGGHLRAGSPAP